LRQAITNTIAEVITDAGAMDYVSVNVRARGAEALVSISAAMPATATRAVDPRDLRITLRLARLLIEAMGGSVSVERAALGKGARVTLRLPVQPAAGAPHLSEAPSPR
jgi:hypothetical protein